MTPAPTNGPMHWPDLFTLQLGHWEHQVQGHLFCLQIVAPHGHQQHMGLRVSEYGYT